ncbi:basic proline-rich protein-like [Hyaena hyaena]|uniref:basic proline-rich protein-like n=1 Tax=Hyaena hyaena TaxID=95912 RepID=UPI00192403BD|nr:basic proline-rich protein-like [Hyaena hyaena]
MRPARRPQRPGTQRGPSLNRDILSPRPYWTRVRGDGPGPSKPGIPGTTPPGPSAPAPTRGGATHPPHEDHPAQARPPETAHPSASAAPVPYHVPSHAPGAGPPPAAPPTNPWPRPESRRRPAPPPPRPPTSELLVTLASPRPAPLHPPITGLVGDPASPRLSPPPPAWETRTELLASDPEGCGRPATSAPASRLVAPAGVGGVGGEALRLGERRTPHAQARGAAPVPGHTRCRLTPPGPREVEPSQPTGRRTWRLQCGSGHALCPQAGGRAARGEAARLCALGVCARKLWAQPGTCRTPARTPARQGLHAASPEPGCPALGAGSVPGHLRPRALGSATPEQGRGEGTRPPPRLGWASLGSVGAVPSATLGTVVSRKQLPTVLLGPFTPDTLTRASPALPGGCWYFQKEEERNGRVKSWGKASNGGGLGEGEDKQALGRQSAPPPPAPHSGKASKSPRSWPPAGRARPETPKCRRKSYELSFPALAVTEPHRPPRDPRPAAPPDRPRGGTLPSTRRSTTRRPPPPPPPAGLGCSCQSEFFTMEFTVRGSSPHF